MTKTSNTKKPKAGRTLDAAVLSVVRRTLKEQAVSIGGKGKKTVKGLRSGALYALAACVKTLLLDVAERTCAALSQDKRHTLLPVHLKMALVSSMPGYVSDE